MGGDGRRLELIGAQVTGGPLRAGDTALVGGGAEAVVGGIKGEAAREQGLRLGGAAVVGQGAEVEFGRRDLDKARAGAVRGEVFARDAERAKGVWQSPPGGAVGHDGVLDGQRAKVEDAAAAVSRGVAREGAVGDRQRAEVADAAAYASCTVLPAKVLLVTVSVPSLEMPPPLLPRYCPRRCCG